MSGLCTLRPTQGPGVFESDSPLSLSLYTCPKEAAAIGLRYFFMNRLIDCEFYLKLILLKSYFCPYQWCLFFVIQSKDPFNCLS